MNGVLEQVRPLRRPAAGLTRRRLLSAAAGGAVLVSVAGCGGTSTADGGAGGDGFPVHIDHKYGTTTVPALPERVVCVGLTEQDPLMALGVVPVATTKWLGSYPGEIGPWAKDRMHGAATPTVLSDADGIEFEQIATMRPDLILALYSDLTQADYTKLSQLAPTIAAPKGVPDYGVTWEEVTLTIGKALGRTARAQRLVDGVDADFAKARRAHPQLHGRAAAMATIYEGYFVYGRNDPRTQLLRQLGMRFPSDLNTFVGDAYGKSLSEELADRLDIDVLVWLLDSIAKDTTSLHGADSAYGHVRLFFVR